MRDSFRPQSSTLARRPAAGQSRRANAGPLARAAASTAPRRLNRNHCAVKLPGTGPLPPDLRYQSEQRRGAPEDQRAPRKQHDGDFPVADRWEIRKHVQSAYAASTVLEDLAPPHDTAPAP